MKKKLLSLVLTGAMVVGTSVSAFAETAVGNKITGPDNKDYTTDVRLEGNVASDSGSLKPGTLSVTVPTAAAFTVDKDGQFQGTQISVQNSGTQSVDVYAHRFIDTTPNVGVGITVVGKANLTDVNRTRVSLNISGNAGTAYLGSEPGNANSGVYSEENLTLTNSVDEIKIATVANGATQNLTLNGEAGKKPKSESPINDAVSDTFTLRLKIKKSANQ